jgi:lipopolysaccharide export LptBFGC system permease protein LptF
MSSTLFRYIFRDLVRIFLLASGALSAIMSFGGLLRPLYEFGLDIGQVAAILGWSGPAMTAYSLPIAALFATTIVYGRLGADNEVTGCRAAGISYFSMTFPAFVLGILTAFLSLGLLCFIVPACTLRVERIIYSNLAQLAASQIERTHQIRFDRGSKPVTIFAQAAEVMPRDPARPRDQGLRLLGPLIVTFDQPEKGKPQVPEEFYMASEAIAYIAQDHEDDDVTMRAELHSGITFPRRVGGDEQQSMQLSVRTTGFGPIALPSPVRENTKFMDIFRLKALERHPEHSRRIRTTLRQFVTRDQQHEYLRQLEQKLNGPEGQVHLESGEERYVLSRGSAPVELRSDRLVVGSLSERPRAATRASASISPTTEPAPNDSATGPKLAQLRGGRSALEVHAAEIRLRAFPENEDRRIRLRIEMLNCVVDVGGEKSARGNFERPLVVPMPGDIYWLTTRPASEYLAESLSGEDQRRLRRDLVKLENSVISEQHARVSFAVSCFILVMVGCALGLMFRSGNFLSAFAVSVVPALLSIALIVTGQHTCENVGWEVTAPGWTNPLKFGLALIWSGNVAVAVIAAVLLGRLQRQ